MENLQNKFTTLKVLFLSKKETIIDLLKTIIPAPRLNQIINQKSIRVVGLRRSGNHAIINWIKKEHEQHRKKVTFINNIPHDKNPYLHFYQNHLRYNKYPKTILKLKRQAKGWFDKVDCLIYSYEDYSLEQITNRLFEDKCDFYLGRANNKYDVIILRDPFNLLASRFKNQYFDTKSPCQNIIALWIAYAKEYLRETNFLKNTKICINYNHWTSNLDYRQEIAKILDIEFSDAGFNDVQKNGGGSSFDGLKFKGKAQTMEVDTRWKYFQDNPFYLQLINNEELIEYSRKIFGNLACIDRLIK